MRSSMRFYIVVMAMIMGFWLVDAGIDTRFFRSTGYWSELMQPGAAEIYFRLLGAIAILLISVLWRAVVRHRQAEAAARQAGDRMYRELVDSYPDSIVVHRDDQILFVNQKGLAYLNAPDLNSLRSTSVEDFIHPADLESSRQRRLAAAGVLGPADAAEMRIILPDGSLHYAMVSSTPIEFKSEPAVLTFFRDITDEVVTRKDLAASRERLNLALDAAQDGVWDWDLITDQFFYNGVWALMLGLAPTAGVHDHGTWEKLVHPNDKQKTIDAAQAHIRGETAVFETEVRLRHADGHYLWILDRGKVVERSDDGTPMRMAGTHRDITARKEAEIALEVRNRIAETFLTSPWEDVLTNILPHIVAALESPVALLGTLETNEKVRIASHDLNENGAARLDSRLMSRGSLPDLFRELLENPAPKLVNDQLQIMLVSHPVARAVSVPIISKGQVLGFMMVADRTAPYEQSDVETLVSLTGHLAPVLEFHMASENKESQLRQAQKMEAIGVLAGGIAHDFNNILQAILGFATLAQEEAQVIDTQRSVLIANDLDRVVRATQRGRELINRILLFSRRREQEQQPVNVADVISETVGLLANTIPATIEVRTEIAAGCGSIMADPARINQMLLNLATNAFHAMEQQGGILTFELRPSAPHEDPLKPASLATRDMVALTVTDTGCGMDKTTLDRLYDPFFTTKDVGKGTGLGLSVVHGIVADHGGEIIIESAVGRGTAVHVFLPVLVDTDAEFLVTRPEPTGADLPVGTITGRRILFVDDEPDIAALGKALLEKQGHDVLALHDSQTALEHLHDSAQEFDLLITDLTMPHKTGIQIADEVSRIRPALPVVLITGLNDLPAVDYLEHAQIRGVLRKPFGGEALREIVGRILQQAAGRQATRVQGAEP